jgi:vanillate O-demethylase ferredoxin subunit
MTSPAPTRWYAVVRSEDVVSEEVAPVRLLDRELALWRSGDGQLNVWEDRCPHRGTRLTLGTNTGDELVCRYHGWRFASGSGRCTLVPAHPTQKPPQNAVARRYHCVERYGLVWVTLGEASDEPRLPVLDPHATFFTLRSMTVRAPLHTVADVLEQTEAAQPVSAGLLAGSCRVNGQVLSMHYLLHPQSATRTTVHGVVSSAAAGAQRLAILRAANDRLKAVQRRVSADLAEAV